MTAPAVVAMPGNETFADVVARELGAERVPLAIRRFPDGETLATLACDGAEHDIRGRDVALVCTLDRPDAKLVPAALAAGAARDHGASRVVLVAPYFAYLRQDVAFEPGEGVSARHFGRLVSAAFDGVVTVDPHLHRLASLDEVLTVPSRVVHAAPDVARWIAEHVRRPVIVGPDEESRQWVGEVARLAGAPFVTLVKTRHGDREVEVSAPDLDPADGRTPVLVDDIVSTGATMAEAARALVAAGHRAPWCVATHAVCADDATGLLHAAGAERFVTTDTVPHPSARIGVGPAVAAGLADLLAAGPRAAQHRRP